MISEDAQVSDLRPPLHPNRSCSGSSVQTEGSGVFEYAPEAFHPLGGFAVTRCRSKGQPTNEFRDFGVSEKHQVRDEQETGHLWRSHLMNSMSSYLPVRQLKLPASSLSCSVILRRLSRNELTESPWVPESEQRIEYPSGALRAPSRGERLMPAAVHAALQRSQC